jgi:hypothetical protein
MYILAFELQAGHSFIWGFKTDRLESSKKILKKKTDRLEALFATHSPCAVCSAAIQS